MVAPKDDPNGKSKEYIAYSAGFYDGVEQQSAKTLDLMNQLISDDLSTGLFNQIKEVTDVPVKQLINTQVIIDLLQTVQDKIESCCFMCGEAATEPVMINERKRPMCLSCLTKLKMQFPECFE